MSLQCEEESHKPENDGNSVREYKLRHVEDHEPYSVWLCDGCAEERGKAGVVSNWADG